MAVFPDARKHDIDWRAGEFTSDFTDHILSGTRAIEKVIVADAGFVDQILTKIPPETGGMTFRNTDVLIEVKELDTRPVDTRERGERPEKFEL